MQMGTLLHGCHLNRRIGMEGSVHSAEAAKLPAFFGGAAAQSAASVLNCRFIFQRFNLEWKSRIL